MVEIASLLGGTPTGILIILLEVGLFIMAFFGGVFLTKFKYHEQEDRKEFERIDKRFDAMEKANEDNTKLLHTRISELRDEIKRDFTDFKQEILILLKNK